MADRTPEELKEILSKGQDEYKARGMGPGSYIEDHPKRTVGIKFIDKMISKDPLKACFIMMVISIGAGFITSSLLIFLAAL